MTTTATTATSSSSSSSLLPSRAFSTSQPDEKQLELDNQHVVDRRMWKQELRVLRKQFAADWEKLDKDALKKTKTKRKTGYQPLSKEALLESAKVRWQENEERKVNLRALEEAWGRDKAAREEKLEQLAETKEVEKRAAESRRLLWLLERSEDWIPEEDLDLAIATAILEPHQL